MVRARVRALPRHICRGNVFDLGQGISSVSVEFRNNLNVRVSLTVSRGISNLCQGWVPYLLRSDPLRKSRHKFSIYDSTFGRNNYR